MEARVKSRLDPFTKRAAVKLSNLKAIQEGSGIEGVLNISL
jgi:hypothetical protein